VFQKSVSTRNRVPRAACPREPFGIEHWRQAASDTLRKYFPILMSHRSRQLGLSFVFILAAMFRWGGKTLRADGLIDEAQLQSAGLSKYWEARVPLSAGDSVQEAFLIEDMLYVVTDSGILFAIQTDVGFLRWGVKATEPDYTIHRPTHLRTAGGGGAVLVPTTTAVFLYDKSTGKEHYRFRPPFPLGGPIAAAGSQLLAGGSDGLFYSLLYHPRSAEPVIAWKVAAGGAVTAAPVLFDSDKVLFATHGGMVFSCRAGDKAFRWAYRTRGPVFGDPVVDESGAYIASADQSLYKLDWDEGTMLWRFRFPGPLLTGPTVLAHTAYQFCESDGLTAIDADTGQMKWRNGAGRRLLAHSRDRDVLLLADHKVQVVDHASGKNLAAIDADAVDLGVSNPGDDSVYLLGADGAVLCARMESVPYLRRQQIIAAREHMSLPQWADGEAQDASASPKQADSESDPLRSCRDTPR